MIAVVEGSEGNRKITFEKDIVCSKIQECLKIL